MNWFLTAILCIVLVEAFVRLPLLEPLSRMHSLGLRAMRVASAKSISDHWKEQAMGAYARRTFAATLKLLVFLALIFALAAIVTLAFDRGSHGFEAFLFDWRGLTFSAMFATLYAVVRSRLLRARI